MTDAIILRSDAIEATLLPERGARLHRLRAFGHDLLRTPDDPSTHARDPFFWGAYPMAPWCNRAPAGLTSVAERDVELVSNFGDGSAIHGLVASRPWQVQADGSLEMRWPGAGTGWPWRFMVRLVAGVDGDALELEYRLVNLADGPMPAGLGLHPWFRRPIEVRIPGDAVYEDSTASSANPRAVAARFDLRSRAETALGLDATWTALREPAIELGWPGLGVEGRLQVVSSTNVLVALASPEAIDATAVEPQTHGPDPIRRLANGEPDAPLLLAPDAELRLQLTLRLSLARDGSPRSGVWSDS